MTKLSKFRTVANIKTVQWEILNQPGLPSEKVWWYNLSYNADIGQGSYLYKMGPGARSNPHRHEGAEEFYMLEGNLIDSDGFEYTQGDFVSLGPGSKHDSMSPDGCVIVVTHRGKVVDLEKEEL